MTPNNPHVKFHCYTAEHFHAIFLNYAVQLHTIRHGTQALHLDDPDGMSRYYVVGYIYSALPIYALKLTSRVHFYSYIKMKGSASAHTKTIHASPNLTVHSY